MQTLPLEQQVTFKGSSEGLRLLLPPDLSWEEVMQQLQQRLDAGERLWSGGFRVILECQDRLTDAPQLEQVAQLLTSYQLTLGKVTTSRRQTAVAAAVAGLNVEQQTPAVPVLMPWAEPLYLQQTVRSGVLVKHPATVIILGDVNPGAEVHARGDIMVWGKLRGLAHAGSDGNDRALIFALHLAPMQLRIAEYLARAPEGAPSDRPEVAYVRDENIHIALAADFRMARGRS
ncbi:septum site-determining protein MinC [Candidatus Cyanaurora vandensis]|uniref:septum site-determining protein MinC n=1 Tax=Candidatus Cyanaurora vandensis TaxID=2714958 RepID=UPI002579EFB5|nr:septum site-determining protein MinC [Candidatus Cyanaurora vandensis]